MIKKDTVLILGAGASVEYGFPTGLELIKKIINALEHKAVNIDGQYHPLSDLNNSYNNLLTSLKQCGLTSIDAFLKANPNLRDAGKTLIAFVLLDCDTSLIQDYQKQNNEERIDSWYSYLVNALLQGCTEDYSDINKNKLSIITFNYDFSLEFYLYKFIKNKTDASKHLIEYFNRLTIHHVYGQLFTREDLKQIENIKHLSVLESI